MLGAAENVKRRWFRTAETKRTAPGTQSLFL